MPTIASRLFRNGEFTLYNGNYFDEVTQTTISQNQANVMAAEFDEVTLGGVVSGLAKREWSNGNLSVGGFFNETPNEIIFTETGTYTFVAPQGINQITVLAIGGGGGGAFGYGPGGGGGALAYGNNIPVTPGQSYTVVVGAPSQASTFSLGANTYISAGGGAAGTGGSGGSAGGGGGAGGYTAIGGNAGASIGGVTVTAGGAGGVASGTLLTAGFSGGTGGESTANNVGYNAGPNVTGGGGGGGTGGWAGGGAGGGVGLFGLGANGTPGTASTSSAVGWAGTGGSGGFPITSTQTQSAVTALFGGGGAGGPSAAPGSNGAVRIIWSYQGTTRAFPSTNVGVLNE